MTIIHVVEQHHQLLDIWRSQNARSLRLSHLDFHCDMRGLLVNRGRQRAYPTRHLKDVDEGNFIAHSILEGRVEAIRWAHYVPGGRQYDVGTVMYTSDVTSQLRRAWLALTRAQGLPLQYEVMDFSDWRGPAKSEFLNIDWDFLASLRYDRNSISTRMEDFFSRDFSVIPRQVCVCYSPKYSHDSPQDFEHFVQRLASLFCAEVINYPILAPRVKLTKSFSRKLYRSVLRQVKHWHYSLVLWLRQRNIY